MLLAVTIRQIQGANRDGEREIEKLHKAGQEMAKDLSASVAIVHTKRCFKL